jgi:hypothetical protein
VPRLRSGGEGDQVLHESDQIVATVGAERIPRIEIRLRQPVGGQIAAA